MCKHNDSLTDHKKIVSKIQERKKEISPVNGILPPAPSLDHILKQAFCCLLERDGNERAALPMVSLSKPQQRQGLYSHRVSTGRGSALCHTGHLAVGRRWHSCRPWPHRVLLACHSLPALLSRHKHENCGGFGAISSWLLILCILR